MKTAVLIAVGFLAGGLVGWSLRSRIPTPRVANHLPAPSPNPSAADRAAIEKLHQQDVSATLSQDPRELAKLWDAGAVRLEPGSPVEIGKRAIEADDAKERAENRGATILAYEPHVRDLQIVDGWAFEWDEFDASFRASSDGKIQKLRGRALRVLRRQADGSWKFARLMWNLAPPGGPAGR